jgi:hypothetical protein
VSARDEVEKHLAEYETQRAFQESWRKEWEAEADRWGVDHSRYKDTETLRLLVLGAARASLVPK